MTLDKDMIAAGQTVIAMAEALNKAIGTAWEIGVRVEVATLYQQTPGPISSYPMVKVRPMIEIEAAKDA